MKYYPPSNHIYYKNTNIPINKFEIKDLRIIHEIEKEQLIKSYEFLHKELSNDTLFDEKYLKKVHFQIFNFLYDWAGEYRTINISKDNSMFCPYKNLHNFSNEIFNQLQKDNYLRNYEDKTKRDEFIQKLAYYMCEIIVLHPFNEGNGRTIRLFFDMICTYNGYDYINYQQTLKNSHYILASIDCMSADCDKMIEILEKGLSK